MTVSDLERLIQLLARLPGLGPRSARRAALKMIERPETLMLPLATALERAAENIRACATCGNLDTGDTCAICRDPASAESVPPRTWYRPLKAPLRSSAQRSPTSSTTQTSVPSRAGSRQMAQVSPVSRLPQVAQARMLSAACSKAAASGSMRVSGFAIILSAARRAERGPRPGRRASNWIRRSRSLTVMTGDAAGGANASPRASYPRASSPRASHG